MAPRRKYELEAGQIFGRLTVVQEEPVEKDTGHHYYLCRCACGNMKVVRDRSLYSGETRSCGCLWSEAMKQYGERRMEESEFPVGYRQGKLTVLENLGRLDGKDIFYRCQCDCGNILNIRQYKLKAGQQGCRCQLRDRAEAVHKEASRLRRKYPEWILGIVAREGDKAGIRDQAFPYDKKIAFRCTRCGATVEKSIAHVISSNKGRTEPVVLCETCSPHNSSCEEEIYAFLTSFVPASKICRHRRDLIKRADTNSRGYELDFYLPEYKLAIEYNGSYYHSELRKPKTYHLDKFKLCEAQGIRLISIFEIDWEASKDKIKDLIRYTILSKQKIPARKCKVREVSYSTASEFYDAYHIQNKSILSRINLGLYYGKDLMAVMGFGSSSFHNRQIEEGDFELHRFAVKPGYTVVGGASKLLKHFEIMYKPRFLLSYSWNDWFSGGMYSKLGFVLDRMVPPDYYWYLNGACINKRKCRLKILSEKYPALYQEAVGSNASNKEDFVMEHLGAIKVYRSGSKRWVNEYLQKG